MVINNNRDRQRTRVVYVPVNTGGGSGGGSQEKIKVGESGLKFTNTTFTEIPEVFDFSDVCDMYYMFQGCTSLTTGPEMDTSKVTDMNNMFHNCTSLTTVPQMDSSKVIYMDYMFQGCTSLTIVPEMDSSKVNDMRGMFWDCRSLTDLGGFVGLKCDLDLSQCNKLTHDSLMNVINKAADVTASPATLSFGIVNMNKLTNTEKGIATSKGWTLEI